MLPTNTTRSTNINKPGSRRDALSIQQLLVLANYQLDYSLDARSEEIAKGMCREVGAVLSQVRRASKTPEFQEQRLKIADAYSRFSKLQRSLRLANDAKTSNTLSEKLRKPIALSEKEKSIRGRDIASVPSHLFAKNDPRPARRYNPPKTGERLKNTPQLAWCLGLMQASGSLQDQSQSFKPGKEEQERLQKLAIEVVNVFKQDEYKDAKAVAEVVHLAPFLDKATFRGLLKEFFNEIDRSKMLEIHLLRGITRLIQGVDSSHLDPDDMVKILSLVSTRLRDTHHDSENMYQLTLALSQVLDAMADAEIKDLDREKLHEPLISYLREMKRSSDPYLVYQAAYTSQALLCVPDNETTWQGARRRTQRVLQGVSGLVSSVKALDLVKFLESLENIHDGVADAAEKVHSAVTGLGGAVSMANGGQEFLESLRESFNSGHKHKWYAALRGADSYIRDGDFVSFKKLVCGAPCRRNPAFQWGVCQRLGEIAANPKRDAEIRRDAVDFLAEIYKSDMAWGCQASVKKWIVGILRQLALPSRSESDLHLHARDVKLVLQELKFSGDEATQALYQSYQAKAPTRYPFEVAPLGLASSSLLDRAQNKPDVESNIRLLKKQRSALRKQLSDERGNTTYIQPLANEIAQTSGESRLPLIEKARKFLESEGKVFLLRGDSGSGKTLFSQELEFELWKEYKPENGRIPLYINLPTIEKPEYDMVAKQLRKAEFTESQIRELKHHRKFVLICDGYDESQQSQNLYMSNKLNQPGEWDAQMMINCRSEYLGVDYRDRFIPGDRNQQSDPSLLQEAVIAPLSVEQVQDYIQEYVSAAQPLWTADDYKRVLEQIPSLRDLTKNPFLMKLSLDVLPRMDPDQDLSAARMTRVGLYDQFVEQWLERGKKRLGEKNLSHQERAAFESLCEDGFTQHGIEFLKELAVAIYKEQNGNPIVQYSRRDEESWKYSFFSREEEKQLLREACPLTRNGNQFRFIHRSLLEYGVSLAIFDPREWLEVAAPVSKMLQQERASTAFSFEQEGTGVQDLSVERPEVNPDLKSPLAWKNFVNEPSILNFLEERVQREPAFKALLYAYIEQSKKDRKWRIAAANAITILVKAGVQFVGQDLQGIRIPGADLSYGVFDTANLKAADLRKVNLRGAWLRQANLSEAQMAGVHFGELPFLTEDSEVRSCAYSRDGRLFAVGLASGDIKVYNTLNWELSQTLQGQDFKVRCVAFSPDGRQIASANDDNSMRVWDVKTGHFRTITRQHHYRIINSVAYSPQGDLMVSASDDRNVDLWDAKTGSWRKTLSAHTNRVTSVAYSPKRNQVASGSWDNTVRIWDVDTGRHDILRGHDNRVLSVAYSPKDDFVASGGEDKTVRLWRVETKQSHHILSGHSGAVHSVTFSMEGGQVASGSKDGSVRLWDVETGVCRHTLSGHISPVTSVVFSPGDSWIASGSADGSVRLWDISARPSNYITSGHSMGIYSVKCSSQGDQIASGSSDHTVRLWDAETGSCRLTLKGHHSTVLSVAYSPQGSQLASGSADTTVRVWDVKTGDRRHMLTGHKDKIYCVVFSSTGDKLATASGDKTVRLWDPTKGVWLKTLSGHTDEVQSVVYSPIGTQIASGSKDCTVRVWDEVTGACRRTLKGHSGGVTSVVYSARGEQLASASDDKTVRLWDVMTGVTMLTLEGHVDGVTSVEYSPNGERLASGSSDMTVRIWDAASGRCLFVTESFQDPVRSIAWRLSTSSTRSPNYLVTGCGNGSLLMWEVVELMEMCRVRPHWSSTNGALTVTGASVQDVLGLSPLNKQLLEQRGAVGDPVQPLSEAVKTAEVAPVATLRKQASRVSMNQAYNTDRPEQQQNTRRGNKEEI